jgi:DNA-binding MarR family transcriptional regulator
MKDIPSIAGEVSVIMPRISRRILFDLFQSLDIPPAQLFVIMMLYYNGPTHMTDIVRELRVAAPTVTGIIDRLARDGYVRRVEDEKDRRAVVVELLGPGRTIAEKLRKVAAERWGDLLEKIPRADAQKFLDILVQIREAL